MKIPPFKLGATGRFPRGKMHSTDEGELQLGVTVDNGNVVLAFGKPVAWIGLPPEKALELARVLQERAHEANTSPRKT